MRAKNRDNRAGCNPGRHNSAISDWSNQSGYNH